ncbi:hypothetical protein ACFPT7_15730 [Acidicapsa dinghuensis]|uniref:Uncharacterized protein n=1 Tax=Acidicapsa dinghuensis TaxID=2218256 RepID=A0ABW1ELB6_9BACT|nr:hypothetical protein [Acidicapsa dinghuensis]
MEDLSVARSSFSKSGFAVRWAFAALWFLLSECQIIWFRKSSTSPGLFGELGIHFFLLVPAIITYLLWTKIRGLELGDELAPRTATVLKKEVSSQLAFTYAAIYSILMFIS